MAESLDPLITQLRALIPLIDFGPMEGDPEELKKVREMLFVQTLEQGKWTKVKGSTTVDDFVKKNGLSKENLLEVAKSVQEGVSTGNEAKAQEIVTAIGSAVPAAAPGKAAPPAAGTPPAATGTAAKTPEGWKAEWSGRTGTGAYWEAVKADPGKYGTGRGAATSATPEQKAARNALWADMQAKGLIPPDDMRKKAKNQKDAERRAAKRSAATGGKTDAAAPEAPATGAPSGGAPAAGTPATTGGKKGVPGYREIVNENPEVFGTGTRKKTVATPAQKAARADLAKWMKEGKNPADFAIGGNKLKTPAGWAWPFVRNAAGAARTAAAAGTAAAGTAATTAAGTAAGTTAGTAAGTAATTGTGIAARLGAAGTAAGGLLGPLFAVLGAYQLASMLRDQTVGSADEKRMRVLEALSGVGGGLGQDQAMRQMLAQQRSMVNLAGIQRNREMEEMNNQYLNDRALNALVLGNRNQLAAMSMPTQPASMSEMMARM